MNSAFDGVRKIHLMGIGGAGVSGLALLLKGLGFDVSGCDLVRTSYIEKLGDVRVKIGHDSSHIAEFSPDLLIYSSAVQSDNPELREARERRIKIASRGEALSWIFNDKFGIGVAGAHGKTTTSSMISYVLDEAGYDPSIAIGGEVIDMGANARLGKGDIFVAELDESDGSFEKFSPDVTVVTNIDWDHVDKYRAFQDMEDAFYRFVNGGKAGGPAIICADDAGGAGLIERIKSSGIRKNEEIITYGWGTNWDWSAADVAPREGGGMTFSLYGKGKFAGEMSLKVSGEHNALNALAACAAVSLAGVAPAEFAGIMRNFSGAKRRFQFVGRKGRFIIYDDYAHHPAEIKATIISARRSFPRLKLIAVFQPHRYTRTQFLRREFAEALSVADKVFLLPVYSADETPIEGVSSEIIANALNDDIIPYVKKAPFFLCENRDVLFEELDREPEGGLVLTLGAGDVTETGAAYMSRG